MPRKKRLNNPRLLAIWPGMGHVALNAGIYLLSRLSITPYAELEAADLFESDDVEVKEGLILPMRRPRNRFLLWKDPSKRNDVLIFLGESQPPLGKTGFCKEIIEVSKKVGITRVDTFAAMATAMHPSHPSRTFGAATDGERLKELQRMEISLLKGGSIAGLNGILLGSAAEAGMHGTCLLGEMPHIFAQLPFPKASLAILEAYLTMTGIEIDLEELKEQAKAVEDQLGELLDRIQSQLAGDDENEPGPEFRPVPEEKDADDPYSKRIDDMFSQAKKDRSKAFELKKELDRLGVFKKYEDRFLDLFRPSPPQE